MKHVLLLSICLFSIAAHAQTITWSAPQSVAASSYENQHPRVVVNAAGNPIVLWGKGSANNVYMSRWTGSAFSMPMKMNPAGVNVFAASFAGPNIAAKGDTVYIVYKAEPEDTAGIYMLRSINGGANFGTPVRVDNLMGKSSRFPSISTDGAGHPLVAFMKFNTGFTDANWVVARSMNWGNSFMPEVLASSYNGEPVCDCCPGTVVSNGNNVTMLYRNNWSNKRTAWMGHSSNGGASFPMGMDIDETNFMVNACMSSGPDGVIIDDTLYASFMSGAGGAKAYYSKTKLGNMQTSGAIPVVAGMGMGISGQNFPRMDNDGKAVAIVWPQTENNLPQIGMLFASNVQNGFPAWEKVVTNTAGNSIMNVDVAVKNETIHVVWEDMGTNTVRYRKGTFSAATAGINNMGSRNELSLSPVPADQELRLTLQQAETKPCTVTITDVAGRIAFQKEYSTITSDLTIATGTLPAGMYLLKMVTSDGFLSKKFVVSR